MKRLLIIVAISLLSLLAVACQANEQEDIQLGGSPLEIEFGTIPDSNLRQDEITEIFIQVTQDGHTVEDANQVAFEIWYEGEKEHETIPAQHKGNGVYFIEKKFQREGTLNVMYHVTAGGYHSMKKHEILIGK